MARVTHVLSRRGWKTGALLVGGGTSAGLIAWGVAPWLATLAGVTPVLLAIACAIPCLLPLALLLFTGLYLFALPYVVRRRGGRRTD